MPRSDINAKITAIRLIAFHNFTDALIRLPDGGHLFLLGDNGCGKTTVLDAIHYVLTGGELEFNAAARVGARRAGDGRRAQGIVMRLNAEARSENNPDGALCPDGGITYAALELTDPAGRKSCIGIGMRASGMDAELTRWGFVRNGPIDSLPLLYEDIEGRHPMDETELRDALGNVGFFRQISRYRNEVARRYFAGDGENNTVYRDVCDLLGTAKAYKEIVASTRNYDERFRRLLRAPDRELFVRVIRKLREIRDAQADLDSIRASVDVLDALVADSDALKMCLERLQAVLFALARAKRRTAETELASVREQLASDRDEAIRLDGAYADAKDREQEAMDFLSQLKNKDPEGLTHQLAGCERDEQRARTAYNSAKRKTEQDGKHCIEADKALAAAEETLNACRKALSDDTALSPEFRDAVIDYVTGTPAFAELERAERDRLQERRDRLNDRRRDAERTLVQCEKETTACEAALKAAQREEMVPDIPGYAEARARLRESMIEARPLYEYLEPDPMLPSDDLAQLEEALGERVLSALTVRPEDAETSRSILFKDFPHVPMTVLHPVEEENPRMASWFRRCFSAGTSPEALEALWQAAVADGAPKTLRTESGVRGLTFRGIEQARLRMEPCRIGSEARRRFAERRITAAEAALSAAEDRFLAATEAKDAAVAAFAEADAALKRFDDHKQDLVPAGYGFAAASEKSERLHEALEHSKEMLLEAADAHDEASVRLRTIRERIRSAGLEDLQAHIDTAAAALVSCRAKAEGLLEAHTDCKSRIASAETRIAALLQEVEAAGKDETAAHDSFLQRFGDVDSAPETTETRLLELVRPLEGAAPDAVADKEREASEAVIRATSDLEGRLRSEAVASLGFRLAGWLVLDVHDRDVHALAAESRATCERQERDLSAKNRELFEEIMLHDLADVLAREVRRLHEMARNIDRLLRDTAFGNTTYGFALKVRDAYRDMEQAILHPEKVNAADILRMFLARNEDTILNTPGDGIPESLDYRNWFRYELKICSAPGGQITMDSRLKSLGSGGEQAVPNYLLILAGAHFLYANEGIRIAPLLFDEAFYGIDAGRRDALMEFADNLGLQIFVASPDQDGIRSSIRASTTLLIVKDTHFDVHISAYNWDNRPKQDELELL